MLVLGVNDWAVLFPEHAGSNHALHEDAWTKAYATLGLFQLVHAINVKSDYQSIFTVGLIKSRHFNWAIFVAFVLVMAAMAIFGFNELFHVSQLSLTQWGVVNVGSLLKVVLGGIDKAIQRATGQDIKAILSNERS